MILLLIYKTTHLALHAMDFGNICDSDLKTLNGLNPSSVMKEMMLLGDEMFHENSPSTQVSLVAK
jgi:hypothetical protein